MTPFLSNNAGGPKILLIAIFIPRRLYEIYMGELTWKIEIHRIRLQLLHFKQVRNDEHRPRFHNLFTRKTSRYPGKTAPWNFSISPRRKYTLEFLFRNVPEWRFLYSNRLYKLNQKKWINLWKIWLWVITLWFHLQPHLYMATAIY